MMVSWGAWRGCGAIAALVCGMFAFPVFAHGETRVVLPLDERQDRNEVLAGLKDRGVAGVMTPDIWLDRGSAPCPACRGLAERGVPLVVTIRNGRHGAAVAPRTLAPYRRIVGQVLDAYRPILLVVETEENAPETYSDGTRPGEWDTPRDGIDTAEAYGRELEAACAEAHARNIPCTNGGVSAEGMAITLWGTYMREGQLAHACALARRALSGGEQMCRLRHLDQGPRAWVVKMQRVERLLPVYRRAAIDFVNVHWAVPDDDTLAEAVTFLRRATGKPVVSLSLGFPPGEGDGGTVSALLNAAADQGLAYVGWTGPVTEGEGEALDEWLGEQAEEIHAQETRQEPRGSLEPTP